MTATVTAIATAIGQTISANCQTPAGKPIRYLTELRDPVNPPVLLVGISKVEYHAAMGRGNVPHSFDVHLILARASDRAALLAMEAYMSAEGPSSIASAVETKDESLARSLGGVVQDCVCVESGPPAGLNIGTSGAVYLMVPFKVEVIA